MKTFFSFFIPVLVVSALIFIFIPGPFSLIISYAIIVTLLLVIIDLLKGNGEILSNEIETVSNEQIEQELEQYLDDSSKNK